MHAHTYAWFRTLRTTRTVADRDARTWEAIAASTTAANATSNKQLFRILAIKQLLSHSRHLASKAPKRPTP
jgi:hypothetical protein